MPHFQSSFCQNKKNVIQPGLLIQLKLIYLTDFSTSVVTSVVTAGSPNVTAQVFYTVPV